MYSNKLTYFLFASACILLVMLGYKDHNIKKSVEQEQIIQFETIKDAKYFVYKNNLGEFHFSPEGDYWKSEEDEKMIVLSQSFSDMLNSLSEVKIVSEVSDNEDYEFSEDKSTRIQIYDVKGGQKYVDVTLGKDSDIENLFYLNDTISNRVLLVRGKKKQLLVQLGKIQN